MSLARSVSNAELFPPPELKPIAVIMHMGQYEHLPRRKTQRINTGAFTDIFINYC